MHTLTSRIDLALGIRVLGMRALRYSTPAALDDDRPPHPRAASGLVWMGGRLLVIQDDASFVVAVSADDVTAIALPRGPDNRRRFEAGLHNKHHKLDLEACVAIDDDVWMLGSGSTPARDRIAILDQAQAVRITQVAPLYDRVRDAVGGPINLEGAACVGDELWLFHRGNTGPADLGPAVVQFLRTAIESWMRNPHAAVPAPTGCVRFDLGSIDGVRFGFTDAVACGPQVYYLAVAEASPNAVDDGRICGSQLGVIEGDVVRAAALEIDGSPIKVEGFALAPGSARRAWIAIDPDDVERPAQLCEIELTGPW